MQATTYRMLTSAHSLLQQSDLKKGVRPHNRRKRCETTE